MRTRDIMKQAYRDGQAAGKAAASWATDGNTTRKTYETILRGLEDGDPMVLDGFRLPDLSGEYADDPTPSTLAAEYGLSDDDDRVGDACDAWENGVSDAFWSELERVCRLQLAD